MMFATGAVTCTAGWHISKLVARMNLVYNITHALQIWRWHSKSYMFVCMVLLWEKLQPLNKRKGSTTVRSEGLRQGTYTY